MKGSETTQLGERTLSVCLFSFACCLCKTNIVYICATFFLCLPFTYDIYGGYIFVCLLQSQKYYGILHLRDEELAHPKGELPDESDRGYNSFTHIKKWSQAIIFIVFKAVEVAVSALFMTY